MIINEIFFSIDGEVNTFGQGHPSTFIRLAGCNLFCSYCDSQYARKIQSGYEMQVSQILDIVEEIGCYKITITGGEPLYQFEELELLVGSLIELDYQITIETNGNHDITKIKHWSHPNLIWVMDYKLLSSGESNKMDLNNFIGLSAIDWVKFVVEDDKDWQLALEVKKQMQKTLGLTCRFAFSPMDASRETAGWLLQKIKENKVFDCNVNIQIHKLLGIK